MTGMCPEAEAFLLRTERLSLRWLTIDDATLMLAVWNDPTFVRFVGDRGIRTLEEAEATMRERVLKQYEDYGFGPYRVALSGTGMFCGIVAPSTSSSKVANCTPLVMMNVWPSWSTPRAPRAALN